MTRFTQTLQICGVILVKDAAVRAHKSVVIGQLLLGNGIQIRAVFDPKFAQIHGIDQVIVSAANECGEGEHKGFLVWNRQDR